MGVPQRGDFNEHPQHRFYEDLTKKHLSTKTYHQIQNLCFWSGQPPLKTCFLANIVTIIKTNNHYQSHL